MAPLALQHLQARQEIVTQPVRSCSGIDGGGIAGIVIGTIVATLLIVWLINRSRQRNEKEDYKAERDSEVRRRRRRSSRRESASMTAGERETITTSGGTRTFVGDDGRTYRIREPSRVVYKS